jgi:hypothetical protein
MGQLNFTWVTSIFLAVIGALCVINGRYDASANFILMAIYLMLLVRSSEDALTDAGVWRDDSAIASQSVVKMYGEQTGARVQVVRIVDAVA